VIAPVVAHADPTLRPIAVGGYAGVQFLPNDVELGNSWAPDQVPQSGAAIGGRATWWALPNVVHGDSLELWLGIEGEVQLAMSSTGSDLMAGRHSYASPILGTNLDLIALLHTGTQVQPLAVVGTGLNTMFTSSPFAEDDTDPVVYYGLGARWAFDKFAIRVDLRQGVEASRMGGETSTFTCVVAIEKFVAWDSATVSSGPDGDWREEPHVVLHDAHVDKPVVDTTPPPPPKDTDGDGIPDATDKCPDQPEDKDGFQDADGCPDPDNDGDGIADAQDKCPNVPETVNGYQDADGCADQLPDALAALVAPDAKLAAQITFAKNKPKLDKGAKKALDEVAAALRKVPDVRLRVVGHAGTGVSDELAHRRAEAVKWYLIDAGLPADRLDTASAPADSGTARIELQLATAPR
jgi:outer membrane protein OmpA-like peptidoglycan-associated protein